MRVLGSLALASTLRPERRRECLRACQPPLHQEVGGQVLQGRPAVGHAAPATCPPKMPNRQRNAAFQRTRAPGLLAEGGVGLAARSVPASSPCPRPPPAELLGSCGLRCHAGQQSPPCQLGRGSAASKRNGARRQPRTLQVGDVRDSLTASPAVRCQVRACQEVLRSHFRAALPMRVLGSLANSFARDRSMASSGGHRRTNGARCPWRVRPGLSRGMRPPVGCGMPSQCCGGTQTPSN